MQDCRFLIKPVAHSGVILGKPLMLPRLDLPKGRQGLLLPPPEGSWQYECSHELCVKTRGLPHSLRSLRPPEVEGISPGSLCLPSGSLFSTQWTHCPSGRSYPGLIPDSPDSLAASRCSQKKVKLPPQSSPYVCQSVYAPTHTPYQPHPLQSRLKPVCGLFLSQTPAQVSFFGLCPLRRLLMSQVTLEHHMLICPTPTACGCFKSTSQGPGLAGSDVFQCACHTMDP